MLQVGVEGLANLIAEGQETEQQYVSQAELLACHKLPAVSHLFVQEDESILRAGFQAISSFRQAAHPVLEHGQALGGAESRGQRFHDLEVHPPCPAAVLGACFRCVSHQAVTGLGFVQILANGSDLGQDAAIIELKGGQLASRVLGRIWRLPVLSGHQVDVLLGQVDAAFRHEHANHVRVRAYGIVQFHSFSFPLVALTVARRDYARKGCHIQKPFIFRRAR